MPRVSRRRTQPDFDLDLVPILSLIVHLLPMLLLIVRFVTLAEHPVSQPPAKATEAPSREKVEAQESERVIVRATGQGFSVSGAEAGEVSLPCRSTDCAPETYDFDGLQAALRAARTLHPTLQDVLVVPDPQVPYAVIIGVFDVARGKKGETPIFANPVLVVGAPERGSVRSGEGDPAAPTPPSVGP